MELLLIAIIGSIAGFIGNKALNLQFPIWKYVLLGIAGSIIGSFFFRFFGFTTNISGLIGTLISSLFGAALLLVPFKFFSQKKHGSTGYSGFVNKPHSNKHALVKDISDTSDYPDINPSTTIRKKVEADYEEITPKDETNTPEPKLSRNEILELKELIAENDLISVINKLQSILSSSTMTSFTYDELVILKSRLNQLQSSSRKGVLSRDIENIETNKIRDDLLKIINQVNPS